MPKTNVYQRFPLYFFMFLSIFVSVKFIFIFLFKTAFEPVFIFELTPFSMAGSFDNTQLLFISAMVLTLNTYLHHRGDKQSLTYSFLLTSFLLLGIGLNVSFREFKTTNILHYLIFCCFLTIIVIDFRNIAEYEETTDKQKDGEKMQVTQTSDALLKTTVRNFFRVLPGKSEKRIHTPKPTGKTGVLTDRSVDSPQSFTVGELDKTQRHVKPLATVARFNIKTEKIKRIENRIDMLKQEYPIDDSYLPDLRLKYLGETLERNVLGDIKEGVVIVQRGKIKKVNHVFEELFGFKNRYLVDKKFIDLVDLAHLGDVRRYYLNRLKNKKTATYRTVLLKNNGEKIKVNISTETIPYEGGDADKLIIKELS